jgi:oligopeptidase B
MQPEISPPAAPRRPHPIEAHGDTRIDDWYWLRNREDSEVVELLARENEYTKAVMAPLEKLEDELYGDILSMIELTDVTYPTPRGPFAYYQRTVDGLDRPISCRRPSTSPAPSRERDVEDPDEVVILDENELAEGHEYFKVGDAAVSPDHALLAYAADATGSELMTIRIRDLGTLDDLDDFIEGAYYGLAFSADGRNVFYIRPDAAMRPYQVWRHEVGTAQEDDSLVFEEPDQRFFLEVRTTKDRRFVVVEADSTETSEVWMIPAEDPLAEPFVVAERVHGVRYSVEHHDGSLLVLTNADAVNFALFEVPLGDLRPEAWTPLVGHRDDVRLDEVDVIAGWAIVSERHDATTSLLLVPLGRSDYSERVVEAPEAGVVRARGNSDFEARTVRFETTSLVQPRTLHEIHLVSGETEVLWVQPLPGVDQSRYRTERRWAISDDGTRVPMTLAWREDRPEGPGPCLLAGYGSYESCVDPVFAVDRAIHPLMDRGVLFAIAHVRGGGELGRRWYLDGKLANKHHSFEDFVACGRYVVSEGLTSRDQLAAYGRSAGGLLMGASMNLDPGLFRAVVAEVPFVDCLTTMLDTSLPLTVTEQEEWGDPIADEGAYGWIRAYSPYDNVRLGETYPFVLATGGLNDTRVSYFEPAKWVQKLRSARPENAARVLLRTEMSAGHFGPSGRYGTWRRWAFNLAFILGTIGGRGPGGGGLGALAGGSWPLA